MRYIILALFLPLLLAGCTKAINNNSKVTNTNEVVQEEETSMVVYNLEEIKKHNKADDCWLLIDKKVYDVTEYIASAKHPGGAAILEGCGKENGTELFETRPMGSGTPHSEQAHNYLKNFFIADLGE